MLGHIHLEFSLRQNHQKIGFNYNFISSKYLSKNKKEQNLKKKKGLNKNFVMFNMQVYQDISTMQL